MAQWLASKRNADLTPATVLKMKMIFAVVRARQQVGGVAGCERNPVRAVETKSVNNAREGAVSLTRSALFTMHLGL
ncbi:hypothetical protein HRV97_17165 [Sphingomonas sp. HHU CXW]|uniref:Transposase n=1 Tax=Sphingomonas hominis TaxID=2741495 RepID=A0ABX2JQ41_9SPHN|nr:hypothetical protein [Sphingomonas hominis]NTS66866.1 hypothetical protein [Sphingomonas hominis]